MSAGALLPTTAAPAPRRYEVRREAMVVEGHALAGVELAGYLVGQPLGTAPVVIVVGGITASPFPFGDPASGAEAWWPALQAPDLVDLSRATVLCPCWPGNGSTWRDFDRRQPSEGGGDPDGAAGGAGVLPRGNNEGAVPPLSALGLADLIAAWAARPR